jgi:hypothetical protein
MEKSEGKTNDFTEQDNMNPEAADFVGDEAMAEGRSFPGNGPFTKEMITQAIYSITPGNACNRYAWNVMNNLGIRIPPPPVNGNPPLANSMFDALANRQDPGWLFVGTGHRVINTAINHVNSGRPTIAITRGAGSGHVAVVRPQDVISTVGMNDTQAKSALRRGLRLAQGSASTRTDIVMISHNLPMSNAWTEADVDFVHFYSYTGQPSGFF